MKRMTGPGLWVVIVPLMVLSLTSSIVIATCTEVRVVVSERCNCPSDIALEVRVTHGTSSSSFKFTCTDLHDIIMKATKLIFKCDEAEIIRTAKQTRYLVKENINGTISINTRDVREISDVQDLINEIHYFGWKGPQDGKQKYEYYLFGELVLRMCTDNFYINGDPGGYMGVLLSKSSDGDISKVNKDITPESFRELLVGETYREMRDVCDSFFDDMIMLVFGNGEEIKMTVDGDMEKISRCKAVAAQRMYAMVLSEPIRNFRTHIINMMCVYLYEEGVLNHVQYFDAHPMARGGTWPLDPHDINKSKPTGHKGAYGGYSFEQLFGLPEHNRKSRKIKKQMIDIRYREVNILIKWLTRVEKHLERTIDNDIDDQLQAVITAITENLLIISHKRAKHSYTTPVQIPQITSLCPSDLNSERKKKFLRGNCPKDAHFLRKWPRSYLHIFSGNGQLWHESNQQIVNSFIVRQLICKGDFGHLDIVYNVVVATRHEVTHSEEGIPGLILIIQIQRKHFHCIDDILKVALDIVSASTGKICTSVVEPILVEYEPPISDFLSFGFSCNEFSLRKDQKFGNRTCNGGSINVTQHNVTIYPLDDYYDWYYYLIMLKTPKEKLLATPESAYKIPLSYYVKDRKALEHWPLYHMDDSIQIVNNSHPHMYINVTDYKLRQVSYYEDIRFKVILDGNRLVTESVELHTTALRLHLLSISVSDFMKDVGIST